MLVDDGADATSSIPVLPNISVGFNQIEWRTFYRSFLEVIRDFLFGIMLMHQCRNFKLTELILGACFCFIHFSIPFTRPNITADTNNEATKPAV